MPELKFESVLSVSSEDKVHCASNLLLSEEYRKWKCASAGEKQASVVLQIERSSKIDSIAIGNEGSAFIEILVGKSTAASDGDFKVLLVSSSFMSPVESKQNSNINRVRIFHSDKLSKVIAEERWDRVKVVCTQPFNKNIQYGVSFVKLNSPPGEGSSNPTAPSVGPAPALKTIGSFKIKDEDATDNLTPGGLFRKTKTEKESSVSSAASARATSAAPEVELQRSPIASPKIATLKPSPATTKTQTPKLTQPEKPTAAATPSRRESPASTPKTKKQKTLRSPEDADRPEDHHQKKKPRLEEKSRPDDLSQLMKGVVFVLSGFQNPLRRELRDKASDMGAKYKPDWGPECTHLICAFANTPKYEQVKEKGIIVSKKWIEESYARKQLMPFTRFIFDYEDTSSSTEEDVSPVRRKTPTKKRLEKEGDIPSRGEGRVKKGDNEGGDSNDTDEIERISSSDGDDTDDEIRKVQESENKEGGKMEADVYDASTDVDENNCYEMKTVDVDNGTSTNKLPLGTDGLPTLPDFFAKRHFFLYGKIGNPERHVLRRFIVAYGGYIDDYMSDRVGYVVTHQQWDRNFDTALAENAALKFVRPKWIYMCNQKQILVSCFPFNVPVS